MARGNALKSIAVIALLAALAPVALGFSYLIVLRDPTLQTQQIERIAASFARHSKPPACTGLIVRLKRPHAQRSRLATGVVSDRQPIR